MIVPVVGAGDILPLTPMLLLHHDHVGVERHVPGLNVAVPPPPRASWLVARRFASMSRRYTSLARPSIVSMNSTLFTTRRMGPSGHVLRPAHHDAIRPPAAAAAVATLAAAPATLPLRPD